LLLYRYLKYGFYRPDSPKVVGHHLHSPAAHNKSQYSPPESAYLNHKRLLSALHFHPVWLATRLHDSSTGIIPINTETNALFPEQMILVKDAISILNAR